MANKLVYITPQGAAKRGFPARPHEGQRVIDPVTGVVFKWMGNSDGLSDLGFWGALIGAVTGVASLFGGGKNKQAEAAIQEQQQVIAAQQKQIESLKEAQLRQERKTILRIDQKSLPLWLAVGVGAYLMLSK